MIASEALQSLPVLLDGLGNTVLLCTLAVLTSAIVGHFFLLLRVNRWWILRIVARAYVSFMRGTPVLVQLFILFFSMPLIGLGGHPMLAAVIAIGMNSGAYVTEIMRGNLAVVSTGQREAALALGISPSQIWWHIIAPQAWHASIPAFINEFTILLKTTPLASVVGVTELAFAGQMVSARTFRQDEVLAIVALCYLVITIPAVVIARTLESRIGYSRQKKGIH